jgi:hypothetical protein
VDGVVTGLSQPVPTGTELEVESNQRQRAHSASCMNLRQLVVHLVQPVGGERRLSTQGLGRGGFNVGPLVAGKGSHLLGLSLSGGEVHDQGPLCLQCGLAQRRCVQLNHGSGLLTGKLASPLCYHLHGSGLLGTGLHLLPHRSKGSRFSIAAPSSVGESSSWPERLERSPFVVWL